MAIDYAASLFAPIYAAFGTPATLTPTSGEPVAITAIDQSAGIELTNGNDDQFSGGVATMQPAAVVRMAELATAGLSRTGLRRATLAMNGKTWRIDSTLPKPTAYGEADGELLLLLSEV